MIPELDSLQTTLEEMGMGEMEIEHVYPQGDVAGHLKDNADCPCGPLMDIHNGTIFVIHRTWDKTARADYHRDIHGGRMAI